MRAEILVGHAEIVLARLELAEADLAGLDGALRGAFRIATFQTAASLVLAAVGELSAAHPDLHLHVTQLEPDRSLPGLVARDFDLAIAEAYPGHPLRQLAGVTTEVLGSDRLRVAVTRSGATLGELADRPWVMEPEGAPARAWSAGICRDAGFEPDVRFETTDLNLHRQIIAAGLAVGVLPDLVWAGVPPTDKLVDLPGQPARTIVTAVRDGAHHHPVTQAVRASLRAVWSSLASAS